MSSINWLTDKVGVTKDGAFVVIGALFDHIGTEIEHRVGADEASIALPKEKMLEALKIKADISET